MICKNEYFNLSFLCKNCYKMGPTSPTKLRKKISANDAAIETNGIHSLSALVKHV